MQERVLDEDGCGVADFYGSALYRREKIIRLTWRESANTMITQKRHVVMCVRIDL